MVKFDLTADKAMVMEGGTWMIFYHYLAVSTWSKEFISLAARVTHTLAWIRFPGLSQVFYGESFLLSVASIIGRAIRVDMNTLRAERGKFARVCVELDLRRPVIGKICIEGFWYKVDTRVSTLSVLLVGVIAIATVNASARCLRRHRRLFLPPWSHPQTLILCVLINQARQFRNLVHNLGIPKWAWITWPQVMMTQLMRINLRRRAPHWWRIFQKYMVIG